MFSGCWLRISDGLGPRRLQVRQVRRPVLAHAVAVQDPLVPLGHPLGVEDDDAPVVAELALDEDAEVPLASDFWVRNLSAVGEQYLDVRPRTADGPFVEDGTVIAAGQTSLPLSIDTILARGYPGGTDLSGGQWQRVALARALAAVELGAGVVLLDEPTAQLDVRGEAEIFDRILAATRHCTTILVSHRFSTVRHADRICVLEHGAFVELGTHDELLALGGRYRTMFELQAQRFADGEPVDGEEEVSLDVLP